MKDLIYDYAIIGAGAAGLHLALAMLEDSWFANKNILIVEKEDKNVDDRTWSYWEKGAGKWDKLIAKSWQKGLFNTNENSIPLDLAPYEYKMLHSLDFYQNAKAEIAKSNQLTWLKETVQSVQTGPLLTIQGTNNTYRAKQVFDSRIDEGFNKKEDKYYRVLQHFKGWVIESKDPVFDPEIFVMMDYQVKWKDSTSFTYVLPTSPYSAMIEFTLFNLEFIDTHTYDKLLKKYIKEILKIKDYTISKVEYGVIPMSDYPFHKANKKGLTKIGTAGSWVKPSSGYAFKNIEKMAGKVVDNLKQGRTPDYGLINARFRWYDSIYLDVFSVSNELGESIFKSMYSKNSIQQIFKFLDEETTPLEELKIINSFTPWPFLKAVFFQFSGIRLGKNKAS